MGRRGLRASREPGQPGERGQKQREGMSNHQQDDDDEVGGREARNVERQRGGGRTGNPESQARRKAESNHPITVITRPQKKIQWASSQKAKHLPGVPDITASSMNGRSMNGP